MNRPLETHDTSDPWLTRHGRFVGRVGALAVFLGVGTALAVPGVASADTGDSSGAKSTSNASSSTGSDSNKPASKRKSLSSSIAKATGNKSASGAVSTGRSPSSGAPGRDATLTKLRDVAKAVAKAAEDKDDSRVESSRSARSTKVSDSDATLAKRKTLSSLAKLTDRKDDSRTELTTTIGDGDITTAETTAETREKPTTEQPAARPQESPARAEAETRAAVKPPVAVVSPAAASIPAPNATRVTAAIDRTPTAPAADLLAGAAMLALSRRYDARVADIADASQSVSVALASQTRGSSLFTSTAAPVPGRMFLQYTHAAVGEVFKSILQNPLPAILRPVHTGVYVVNSVGRALLTDFGFIRPNPLATPDAIATQREAAALIATPEVQAAKKAAVEYLLTTPLATTSLGAAANRAIVERVVDEYAMALALGAVVTDTPENPRISSVAFLGSRYGMDNPDNAYRGFTVDGNSTYVITGNTNTAAFISFQVVNGIYGENGQTPASGGVIDTTSLQTDEHGNFTITLGPDAADGRPNYIQLTPDSKQVIIRDTYTDWDQVPATLSVERVAGPDLPDPPTFQEQADRLATLIVTGAPYWHGFSNAYRQVPVNTVTPAIPTPGGLVGQSSALGHYQLTEDQALVVTVRPYDADYVGFQVGTDWFTSIDYANHTSSMTTKQATPNADGSYTYVVSLKDPGVANWIDPAGHPTGLLQIRWQGLEAGAMPPGYKPTVQLVNFDELSTVLPEETVMVTKWERQRQIDQRRAQIRERFFGIPANLLEFDLRTFDRVI